MKIILATSSPYRQAAFKFLDLDFVAESSDIDEYFQGRPDSPELLVEHLAKMKADAVGENHDEGIIIGFDSVAYFNGEILEKPANREETFTRLKALSDDEHDFYTGIYIQNLKTGEETSKVVRTKVRLRKLTEKEINKFLDQTDKYTTMAVGFDPLENYSSSFISEINGSYNNITRGIPLETIMELLPDVGYQV